LVYAIDLTTKAVIDAIPGAIRPMASGQFILPAAQTPAGASAANWLD